MTINRYPSPPRSQAELDELIARSSTVFNVAALGAVPDSGVTDNRATFNNAIRAAYDSGGGVVVVPPATNDTAFYGIHGHIRLLPGVILYLQGPRAFIKQLATQTFSYYYNAVIMAGTYEGFGTAADVYHETAYNFGVDGVAGDRAVILASGGNNFAVGDLIAVRSGEIKAGSTASPYASMMTEVLSVSGDVVTLRHPLTDRYSTSSGGVAPTAYKVNTNPDATDGGPVTIEGSRAYLARGSAVIGGGRLSGSNSALNVENRGQALHVACYDCVFDYDGTGGSILEGNPFTRCYARVKGKYRYSAMELGYLSNNSEVHISGQRLGAVSATGGVFSSFAVTLNSEGPTDCTVYIGDLTHYGASIEIRSTILDNGTRNRFIGGTVTGGTTGHTTTLEMGTTARDSLFDGVTVVSPIRTAMYASGTAAGGQYRNCVVRNPASPTSTYPTGLIRNGSPATFINCDMGGGVIKDENAIPNNHYGNKVRTSLPTVWSTTLPQTMTGTLPKTLRDSYPIAQNTLAERGGLRILATGIISGTVGAKTIALEFDGLVLCTIPYTSSETGQWRLDITMYQRYNVGTGVAAQGYFGFGQKIVGGVTTRYDSLNVNGLVDTIAGGTKVLGLYITLAGAGDTSVRTLWAVEPIATQLTGPSA